MFVTEKSRDTFTVIAGRHFAFLECVMRFERSGGAHTVWFNDGSCKRVALEDDTASRSDATLVSDEFADALPDRNGKYSLYDARLVVDTDGEEWVLTELGLNCPRCLEYQRNIYRILERTGHNPFTGQPFVRSELSDEMASEEDFARCVLECEGLGRSVAVNESVRAAAIARRTVNTGVPV